MNLLIDNYDSFTYNLSQLISEVAGEDTMVLKNDDPRLDNIELLNPTHLILSPGPGRPEDAGKLISVLKRQISRVPILGVCLGHQAITEVYGGKVVHAPELMHGKASKMKVITASPLFANCPDTFIAARYHSLIASPMGFPSELKVIAETKTNEIMAIADEQNAVYGVQFHPESIMTDEVVGRGIISNFLGIKIPETEKASH
ncbi:aminodeoxychorismate/anthranilate synthase component II [Lentilactobacillus sp. Marseille-Q4993]|uniref:anthranilate synthase component II n=1 Tax=Lentilactobacillus sp. Marseille-Q4993 TaxID=3039492 RepID=UPI0024BC94EA|nr:aminodeoxychorismate/anthranilate synthase component II [Lentilactobacillus sp. Marseille-Q4993]